MASLDSRGKYVDAEDLNSPAYEIWSVVNSRMCFVDQAYPVSATNLGRTGRDLNMARLQRSQFIAERVGRTMIAVNTD
jgi:hypothetical protein